MNATRHQVRTVRIMKTHDQKPARMIQVRIEGRRTNCTIRFTSLHILLWMLTSNGCEVRTRMEGDSSCYIDPTSVTLETFDAVLEQAEDTGLGDLFHDVSMVHVLLCAHLGSYEADN